MAKLNIKNRRYLGSKAKLLSFIEGVVSSECTDVKSFVDLFAGTGNVAWNFNNVKTSIIVNDSLYSNYCSYEAWFGKQKISKKKIADIINYYNNVQVRDDNYFSDNFSDTFFSVNNCKKIGFIREDIEKKYSNKQINLREYYILITSLIYSMDKIANTVGHYDAYRMNGDLEKKLILEELDLPENDINKNNKIYCEDANELVKKIKADVVYIDPPYNSRQYCDAYHLLENVARWEKPEVFGTARKMDRSKLKSEYCKNYASKAFEDLIKNINSRYILVSYNNMGTKGAGRSQAKISDEDIIRILSEKGKVKIFESKFQQFTTGKSNIEDHKERLFLCIVGEKNCETEEIKDSNVGFVKSPLNYTGGKYRLLPQLTEKFPKKFDTFIDLFAGGFNVGANIDCKQVIYNDKQREVARITNLFNKYQYNIIINKIEENIFKYKLSDTYKYGYEYYGCNSDSGVGKYNKDKYIEMRTTYNNMKEESEEKDFLLLTLILFSFNNQIRFNSNGEYNMPVGKRDFNACTRKNVKEFSKRLHKKNIIFENCSFDDLSVLKYPSPFVYCDPPYLLGTAAYNENDGWTEEDEIKLLNYLEKLNMNKIPFALSNVIEHKGNTNKILKDWVDKNRFNLIYIKSNYNNSNYHIKEKENITLEVLVTNY